MSTRRRGRAATARRSSSETALDLPTPVVPTSAKWRDSMSWMLTVAGMLASCVTVADLGRRSVAEVVHQCEIARPDAMSHGADRRIIGDAALEARASVRLFLHFSEELDLDLDRIVASRSMQPRRRASCRPAPRSGCWPRLIEIIRPIAQASPASQLPVETALRMVAREPSQAITRPSARSAAGRRRAGPARYRCGRPHSSTGVA